MRATIACRTTGHFASLRFFLAILPLLVGCTATIGESPPTRAATASTHQDVTPAVSQITATQATATVPPSATLTPQASSTPPPPAPTETPQPTPCAQSGRVVQGSFASSFSGSDHAYALYLPPCYAHNGASYPTLYLMAGNIHDENKWVELGLAQAADEAIRQEDVPPLIIVMPDGGWLANNTSGGPGSYESLILDELVPHIEASTCASSASQHRAIGGLSRGGYWALEIAFRFPDRFVSVGGHSAALLDTHAGPHLNPQFTALSNDLGSLRIYLDIGSDDYLRTNTIQLHQDMEAAGVAHEWHLNEGQHIDAYWVQNLPDYLRWYGESWPLSRDSYPPCQMGTPAP